MRASPEVSTTFLPSTDISLGWLHRPEEGQELKWVGMAGRLTGKQMPSCSIRRSLSMLSELL